MSNDVSYSLRAAVSLKKHDFKRSRSLGQNFLLDDDALRGIVERAEVMPGDNIIEIGPGTGVLTAYMLDAGARVLAIELDRALSNVFEDVVGDRAGVTLVISDALKCDIVSLARDAFGDGAPYSIVANLPYYITADFVLRALSLEPKPERVTIMVQKEAARRMLSSPGSDNWCALAAHISYCARAGVVMDAPAALFTPAPHVDSCLIRLDVYSARERPVKPLSEAIFLRVLNAAFRMRRKTMANNLASAFGIDRARAEAAIARAGKDVRSRGEEYTLAELCAVADALDDIRL